MLRRLLKRLPSSADFDAVLEHDNETNDLGRLPSVEPARPAPLSRLKAQMGVQVGEPAEDVVQVEDEPECTGGDEPA